MSLPLRLMIAPCLPTSMTREWPVSTDAAAAAGHYPSACRVDVAVSADVAALLYSFCKFSLLLWRRIPMPADCEWSLYRRRNAASYWSGQYVLWWWSCCCAAWASLSRERRNVSTWRDVLECRCCLNKSAAVRSWTAVGRFQMLQLFIRIPAHTVAVTTTTTLPPIRLDGACCCYVRWKSM